VWRYTPTPANRVMLNKVPDKKMYLLAGGNFRNCEWQWFCYQFYTWIKSCQLPSEENAEGILNHHMTSAGQDFLKRVHHYTIPPVIINPAVWFTLQDSHHLSTWNIRYPLTLCRRLLTRSVQNSILQQNCQSVFWKERLPCLRGHLLKQSKLWYGGARWLSHISFSFHCN
jgi:hypothetical protein